MPRSQSDLTWGFVTHSTNPTIWNEEWNKGLCTFTKAWMYFHWHQCKGLPNSDIKGIRLSSQSSGAFSDWECHSPPEKKDMMPIGQTADNSHLPPKRLKSYSQCIHVSTFFLEDGVFSLYCINLQGKVIFFSSGMLVSLGGSQYIANWLLKTAINSINKHVGQNAAFEATGRAQVLL